MDYIFDKMKYPHFKRLSDVFYFMMGATFFVVAISEKLIAEALHLTYNEVNIIVYYMLVPLSWCIMLDVIIGLPIFSPLLIVGEGIILWHHRHDFSKFCDIAFKKSQDFLLWFKRIGWNYCVSSVIICVIVPLIIYAALFIMI